MKSSVAARGVAVLLALAASSSSVVAQGVDDGTFNAELQANLTKTLNGQISTFEANKALIDGNTTDTGNNFGGQGSADVDQESLTLDPSQISLGSQVDGTLQPGADAGQVRSRTSNNNFINFCATQQMPLANGLQFRDTESCIPIPMGAMPKVDNIPTTVFTNPATNANLKAQTPINIQVRTTNMELGNFVNAGSNYYSAPQELRNSKIIGHSHIVCHRIDSIESTRGVDSATDFQFFKGVNAPPSSAGILTATLTPGLTNGAYRCCTMTSAANHQPVLVSIAQRISQDDCTRFIVTDGGDASLNAGDAASAAETKQFLADAAAAFAAGNSGNPQQNDGAAGNAAAQGNGQGQGNNGNRQGNNGNGQGNGQGRQANAQAGSGSGSGSGSGNSDNAARCIDGKRKVRRELRRSRQHGEQTRHRA